uniref:Uncharacterized protein n=1 Tax=Myoviridae sp. ctPkm1 TaxID=2825099 RepID=A0A8S5TYD5_9CAUD|nr:MAG TPA: hypothetical protein [Myoviridae sp. ctPkm1]
MLTITTSFKSRSLPSQKTRSASSSSSASRSCHFVPKTVL